MSKEIKNDNRKFDGSRKMEKYELENFVRKTEGYPIKDTDASTKENIVKSMQMIGNGKITYDDYQESYLYEDFIGDYTLCVWGKRKDTRSALPDHEFRFEALMFRTSSVRTYGYGFSNLAVKAASDNIFRESFLTNQISTLPKVIQKMLAFYEVKLTKARIIKDEGKKNDIKRRR